MAEIIEGWQCVGCGKIDVPRSCIGICEDRRLKLVAVGDYYMAVERAERAERECRELRALLGQLARALPAGDWSSEGDPRARERALTFLAETETA